VFLVKIKAFHEFLPMLKEALGEVLSEQERALLSSSFDVIGDIAIIKIPEELRSREQLISNQILSRMKNVRTVLKQSSDVQGEFRTRELSFIGGKENYDTIYKEGGCLFRVNVRDVYFSPRLSTERERIASLVQNGERILNMFAGIGTFSIIIAKKKEVEIESVDINPIAIELARQSLTLNKKLKGHVNPVLSDALPYAFSHENHFDRILMPLPERSFEFLPAAFNAIKGGGTIHYYVHVPLHDFEDPEWIVSQINRPELKNIKGKVKVEEWKKVREVGPRYIQAVADINVHALTC
jgi:tRNA (guanine37-N1)-methyltransferase